MIGSKEKYALVTGASSGIGYELAKRFAKDGKNIVVVARRRDRLEQLKRDIENDYRTRVVVLVKDLSKPSSPQEIFTELEQQNINIDVLVNNAGYSVWGMFSQTELQRELDMIQVNITSLTHLTKLFLKKMLDNKSGKILNVSSGVGFYSAPLMAVYASTKSYVLHFSEALADELKGTGVTVTCLFPDATKTEFWEMANASRSRATKAMENPAKTAENGYRALEKGKKFILSGGLINRLAPITVRIAPRSLIIRSCKYFLEQA
jgi:short-subunit dehydrogenase